MIPTLTDVQVDAILTRLREDLERDEAMLRKARRPDDPDRDGGVTCAGYGADEDA